VLFFTFNFPERKEKARNWERVLQP